MSSFLDDLFRTLRSPLEAFRNKIWGIRSVEGRIQGNINRIRSLPAEFKGEARQNIDLVKSYGRRAEELKGRAQGHGSHDAQRSPADPRSPLSANSPHKRKAKMGLFSKKKKCPNCREKLHISWDLCPYCGYGAAAPGGAPPSGPARTQALSAAPSGGGKGRTLALDAASGGGGVGWLVPVDGPQTGELFELKGHCVIGTAPECDVVVRDPSISGRHAEFSVVGQGFRISDLGSTNGTFVNDKRVTSSDLVDNDNVRLGQTAFKFKSIA